MVPISRSQYAFALGARDLRFQDPCAEPFNSESQAEKIVSRVVNDESDAPFSRSSRVFAEDRWRCLPGTDRSFVPTSCPLH